MSAKRSGLDWVFEVIGLAGLVTVFGVVIVHWSDLPSRVPMHFGASGLPNGWGGKGGMWLLPGTSLLMYLLLTAASRYQRLINVPFAVERDSPAVQQILLSMSIVMKAASMVAMAYIASAQVNTAIGRANGLGQVFLPLFLLVIFVPIIVYLVKLWRAQTP